MRRVWAAALSAWALLAVVAVLAWSHAPGTQAARSGARVVSAQSPRGPQRVVLAPAPHATTRTSGVATAQPAVVAGQAAAVVTPPAAAGGG